MLVCDCNKYDSILFLEKNLKNIINSSTIQKNIILIANIFSSDESSEINDINKKVIQNLHRIVKNIWI